MPGKRDGLFVRKTLGTMIGSMRNHLSRVPDGAPGLDTVHALLNDLEEFGRIEAVYYGADGNTEPDQNRVNDYAQQYAKLCTRMSEIRSLLPEKIDPRIANVCDALSGEPTRKFREELAAYRIQPPLDLSLNADEKIRAEALLNDCRNRVSGSGVTFPEKEFPDVELPMGILLTGSPEELAAYYVKKSDALNDRTRAYLRARIENAFYLNDYAEKAQTEKHAPLFEAEPSRNGGVLLNGHPEMYYQHQSSGNGCWSCAYAMILASRGVFLDQRMIRAFRPDIHANGVEDIVRDQVAGIVADKMFSPYELAELTSEMLPANALRQVVIGNYQDKGETEQEAYRSVIGEQIRSALTVHKSPVALRTGGHFVTVIGIEGDTLTVLDSQGDTQTDQIETRSLKTLMQEHDTLAMTWTQDLRFTKEGACANIPDGFGARIAYTDGKLTELAREDHEAKKAAYPMNVSEGHYGMDRTVKVGETNVVYSDSLYMPSRIPERVLQAQAAEGEEILREPAGERKEEVQPVPKQKEIQPAAGRKEEVKPVPGQKKDKSAAKSEGKTLKKFQKKLIKDYEGKMKNAKPCLLSGELLDTCRRLAGIDFEGNQFRQAEEFRIAKNYSSYESVGELANAYVCTVFFEKLKHDFPGEKMDMADADFAGFAKKNLYNPYFRIAVEMAANTGSPDDELRKRCGAITAKLNEMVMMDTLSPVGDTQKAELKKYNKDSEKATEEMIRKNKAAQSVMAKFMFMSHLGSLYTKDENGRYEPYNGSMTEVFAHGGRTMFAFSKGNPGENTLEKIVFKDHRVTAGDDGRPDVSETRAVSGRTAATHDVEKGTEDEGPDAYKEIKVKVSFRHNYSFDPAIGGLGNRFGESTITNEGSDGHCYIKMKEGSESGSGYIMFGIEGSSTGGDSKTGRNHDASGGSGQASAFLCGKSAPGAKLGGRVADLSIWDRESLAAILSAFEQKYNALQEAAYGGDAESIEKLRQVNEKLCGPMMNGYEVSFEKAKGPKEENGYPTERRQTRDEFGDFLMELGISSVTIRSHDVPAGRLSDYRHLAGSRAFNELNRLAEQKKNGPTLESLADELYEAKRTSHGKEINSPEMQAVKNSLQEVLLIRQDDDRDEDALRTHMKALKEYADAYLNAGKSHNRRYELVKAIRKVADEELKALSAEKKKTGETESRIL